MKRAYKKYFKMVALVWAGCFVLFFIAYILVLAPQGKNKKHIETQLIDKKQTYDSALRAAQQETRARLNKQIEHLRNKLNGFVIDFEDSADLTFDISQIANRQKVASFSIKNKDKFSGSKILNYNYITENHIKVSFAAGFNQFAAFLNTLERHHPVVFIDKFTITQARQNDSEPKIDMDLTVLVTKQQES